MPKQQQRNPNNYQGVNTQQKFSITSRFLGYRNKEDNTNLPAGYLVNGSQNVLLNTAGRISITKGYTLDGSAGTSITGVTSSFDALSNFGTEIHLRAGNSLLEYRYVNSSGSVSYRTLMSSLTSTSFNFVDYWNDSEKKSSILFVNNTANIYEWSGGITTFASCTSNTITKQGTATWAESGFFSTTSGRGVVINGTTYTYTGGEGTTTLTGVSPDPTGAGYVAGDVIHQAVKTTANAGGTGKLPTTIKNTIIGLLNQQVYIADSTNRTVYVSKINDYTDYNYTSPVRKPGEGAILTLDGNPIAFIPQEKDMYMSDANNGWYKTTFTLASDLTGESLTIEKLKTSPQQGAKSQALVCKIKNDVAFLSQEPAIDTLGRIQNILGTPQTDNISDPIKNDFDSYDFTGGSMLYHRRKLYVAIPNEGLYRIYNLQPGIDALGNTILPYWEAPQTVSISRFAIIDGELYGHSSLTMETYKMNDGYNFNNQPINAKAIFCYQNFGIRELTKYFNEYYVEGYISSNTKLDIGINYEIDGCLTSYSSTLLGSDTQVVCVYPTTTSLGKSPIGKEPLGGQANQTLSTGLPPKFRTILTMPRNDFYEMQSTFSSDDKDSRWEILAFGPLATLTMYGNSSIKK